MADLEENNVMNIASAPEPLPSVGDNITDEEKELRMSSSSASSSAHDSYHLTPHVESIISSLNPSENDYEALFALSLLYAIGQNEGKSDFLFGVSIVISLSDVVRCERRAIVLGNNGMEASSCRESNHPLIIRKSDDE